MMDPSDKVSDSEQMSCKPPTPERVSSDGSNVKTCLDCGTSKTPLWRGGPAGPKSLCNACGIKSWKKRKAVLGIVKEEKKTKKQMKNSRSNQISCSNSSTSSSGDCTINLEDSLKNSSRLWAFVSDVAFQRPRSNTTQRRKYGEMEQAAILLMALSCGSA